MSAVIQQDGCISITVNYCRRRRRQYVPTTLTGSDHLC